MATVNLRILLGNPAGSTSLVSESTTATKEWGPDLAAMLESNPLLKDSRNFVVVDSIIMKSQIMTGFFSLFFEFVSFCFL